ncbi:MAG TPA: peptidase T [Anaerolineaceae bacterium]
MSSVVERFLRYIQIDTRSDHEGKGTPSTSIQFDLARLLEKELKELSLQDVHVSDLCFVTATLPSNVSHPVPVIGFNAHIDTSPDFSGTNVKPQIVKAYDGGDIVLNAAENIVLSPREFPELSKYVGQTLITTDGTTLLGADDKAGIAEIMAAIEILVCNPELPHGTIKVAFTSDEEIGTAASLFDTKKFGADFAYTVDGGGIGALNYENFNAARARVTIQGRSVHPGTAKNKMINALQVAIEFHNLLPAAERPEYTEKYEGFFHLIQLEGTVESASFGYLIRDHSADSFAARKALLARIADQINAKYGSGTVTLEIHDQYRNMRELIEPVMHIVDTAKAAMLAVGIEPVIEPIRGGTDGAQFTYNGLPTPNLFTGGHNAHGRYEFIPIPSMEKATQVILKIIEMYATRSS